MVGLGLGAGVGRREMGEEGGGRGHWKVGEGGGPGTVPSLIHDGDRCRGDESRAGACCMTIDSRHQHRIATAGCERERGGEKERRREK